VPCRILKIAWTGENEPAASVRFQARRRRNICQSQSKRWQSPARGAGVLTMPWPRRQQAIVRSAARPRFLTGFAPIVDFTVAARLWRSKRS